MATPVTGTRTAQAVLAWSRDLVRPPLLLAVQGLPASVRHIAGYHLGWWDRHGRPARASSGKSVRPALALLAAQSCGAPARSALPAAVAVELAHNFSLLHDDVLDQDTTRRHRPTAWSVFGTAAAILTGDALLALASGVLARSVFPATADDLSAAVLALVDGEQADLSFETRDDVDLAECVAMVEHKTAPLLAAACALGGVFGGASPEVVGHLRAFGESLGVAYQHVDDLLGIWGDPSTTGKPAHGDLLRRKKSLPVVAALTSGTPAGAELASLYRSDDADPVRLAALVEQAGGREWSESEASRLLAEALDHLAATDPTPRAAAELTALAHLIVRRTC
ncbi:polyprenyl synthetase family protein [Saccharothrix variisporea]|uniref:Geranylgeranyl diphosphate synthase type I n=1 Tax=Saccharothrix variisporea TaxID=543527 RepID=A0A495X1A2_9PSEU|nr:polyprenyl synthetase family protein [Saccharothrix variisporea]RKT67941.1 geranylgeranyl diphosphate synthase type I [Saccharothrix variisporea]